MKNSTVLLTAALAFLIVIGVVFLIQEWDTRNNTPTIPTEELNEGGFRYHGLWVDIDTSGNGSVQIGPHALYRMGYHDGLHGYPRNPVYDEFRRYNQGYEHGLKNRP